MTIATALLPKVTMLRSAAAILHWAALAVLFGCGSDGTGSNPPTRISITPAQPVSLYAGDTLTVQATIRNSSHTGVSYSSSAPAVAAADEVSGLVTALSVGEATITAMSVIDPRIYAQVQLLVLPDLPASVTIDALRLGKGGAANPANVQGVIAVNATVAPGNARRLEFLLGEVVVCQESFSSPASGPPSPASFACRIDTSAYDEANGTPRFLNGATTLVARLVASGERVLAQASKIDVRLANPARIIGTVTAERHALDSAGKDWISGGVLVEAQPVLYDAGTSVHSVAFGYTSPGGADTTFVDTSLPFASTLPGDGILAAVTDSAFGFALSSLDAAGKPGPDGRTPSYRYDNAPPTPGTLVPREWVGSETRFADSYSVAGETDPGIGRISLDFFAGDPGLSTPEIVEQGTPVTVGADLRQAPRQSYRLALRVCDALENCVVSDGYLFGVDRTSPVIETVSLADRLANPGADLVLGVRDDLSGFPQRFLEVSTSVLSGQSATLSCGPVVAGVDLPGRPTTHGCAPDTLESIIPVPRAAAGYYSYAVTAFDRAGNRSAEVRRTLLIDLEPPSLGPINPPAALVPGEEMSVSVQAADDLELTSVDFRLVYGGAAGTPHVAIPFASPEVVGVPFDEVLSSTASTTAASPFVRTLTYGGAAGGERVTLVVDSLRVTARDAALLSTTSAWWVPRAAFGNDTSTADPFPRFTTAITTVDRTSVCTAGCGADDPIGLRIATRVEGESGTGRPFARLHFYRRGSGGDLTYLASVAGTDATIANTGTHSTITYTLDHVPPRGLSGDFNLVAVGVTSRGNALITALTGPDSPLVSFYRR